MEWKTLERPGFLGKRRDEQYAIWDKQYGPGNWRFAWKVVQFFVDFLGACALYEDAYCQFLVNHRDVTATLTKEACDIYDDEPSNIYSKFDYNIQESLHTHIQDIAIRRCLIRMGLWFKGSKLVRIRQEKGDHPLSMVLSPGRLPFHRPDLIVQPEVPTVFHYISSH